MANGKDKHHARAVDALRDVSEPLVTTWPVLTETCHLLLRYGKSGVVRFMRGASAFRVFEMTEAHLPRIAVLLAKYADLPMDLADASLVVAAEELGSGRILSTDERDFHAYRWKNHKPFRNLFARSKHF
ncbi:MAG: type II toxin-antitoxin system VapC family toxin [Polyangiaceae bacterium]